MERKVVVVAGRIRRRGAVTALLAANTPMSRSGSADEAVPTLLWWLSGASPYTTCSGRDIAVSNLCAPADKGFLS